MKEARHHQSLYDSIYVKSKNKQNQSTVTEIRLVVTYEARVLSATVGLLITTVAVGRALLVLLMIPRCPSATTIRQL